MYDQLLAGELMDTQVEIDVLQAALGPELLPKEGTKMKARVDGPAAPRRWWPWGPWATCGSPSTAQVTEITGYVGGEKIGLLEDEQVQKILKDKYRLSLDYSRAGSIEMVTTLDRTPARNSCSPPTRRPWSCSKRQGGAPEKSQIVFNTPIVLYTHAAVAEALTGRGRVLPKRWSAHRGHGTAGGPDGVRRPVERCGPAGACTAALPWAPPTRPSPTPAICSPGCWPTPSAAAPWARRTCPELAAPAASALFQKLGYMESSSSDLFDQFLKTGMGAKPLIAGYESQLAGVRRAGAGDLGADSKGRHCDGVPHPHGVVLPCVSSPWTRPAPGASTPCWIEEVQRLAWENHGFRTGVYDAPTDTAQFGVEGVAEEVTQVAPMPGAPVMEAIIAALS